MKSGLTASLRLFKAASRKRVLGLAAASLACDFLYALYHGILGVLQPSLWFLAIWKRRKRAQPQTFDIVQVARQVWDKNANRWIVTLLEAPAQYATQEVLQTFGLVENQQTKAPSQGAAAAGAMKK